MDEGIKYQVDYQYGFGIFSSFHDSVFAVF